MTFAIASRFYQGERFHYILAVCPRDTMQFTSLSTTYLMTSLFYTFWNEGLYFISRKLCISYLLNKSNTLFKYSQDKCLLLQWIFWISPGNWSRHMVPFTILLIIALKFNIFSEIWIQFPKDLTCWTSLMQKFCWQFNSLSVVGISSVSLLKFIMLTWYHTVLHRFQRCVRGYFAIWLLKQLCEIGEADTFIFFLCTWKLRNKWVETHCLNEIFWQFI